MTRVRMLAALLAGLGAGSAHAAVVLNEVLYDPAGDDTGAEYVELWNNGDAAESLAGLRVDGACDDDHRIRRLLDRFATTGGELLAISNVFQLGAGDDLIRALFGTLPGKHLFHQLVIVAEQLNHETERIGEFQFFKVVVNRRRRVKP